jgi:TonB family protein
MGNPVHAFPRASRRAGGADATRAFALFGLVSLAAHVGAVCAVPAIADALRPIETVTYEIDLRAGDGSDRMDGEAMSDARASRLVPGGAESPQNIDADDRGRGGDGVGAAAVLLLLPRPADLTLTDSTLDAIGVGQTQRIDTAQTRSSLEDRRATPSPRDEPFLASGTGEHRERRPVAATDAATGARRAPSASTSGGASADRNGEIEARPRSGVIDRTAVGALHDSPGVGIAGGTGTRESEAAMVAFGRPEVDPGPAATTTETRDRPRDDTRSELLATSPSRSLVEATERSGPRIGVGVGGIEGSGPAGSGGGTREGGRALARGFGHGAFDSLDTSDARYVGWLRALRHRVDQVLVFPRARQLAMDQGTSVFRVTVHRDGSIAHAPHLIRSSGFSDLDAAAREALDHALPLDPIPSGLFADRTLVDVTVPIEFWNPMAR